MQVILAAVISLDGKIRSASVPNKREWISDEDKGYFNQLLDGHNLIVMGRKTYISMALVPQAGKQYVVVTRSPELYKHKSVMGALVFSNSTPQQIVEHYGKLGFKRMLLTGGSKLYASFLDAHLVDELDITIEPIVLGNGNNFIDSLSSKVNLCLVKQTVLNTRGTLLLNLKIMK